MNKRRKNSKLIWSLIIIITYFMSYLLCVSYYTSHHISKDWPLVLFLFGMFIVIICSFFNLKKVMIFTVVGYIVGFVFGIWFNKDGIDPGGGRTNNAWIIWTYSFLLIILIGVVGEIIDKLKRRNEIN